MTSKKLPAQAKVVIVGGGMMGAGLLLGYCYENLIPYFAHIA